MNTEPLCKNQSVLIVGTGPNYEPYDGHNIAIGANGGVALQHCEILCTTSHLFRDGVTGSEFETRRSLIARSFASIWIDTKNGNVVDSKRALMRNNIGWTNVYGCDEQTRKEIVQGACGVDLWVSTGVFAVCLAVYSGAKVVRTTGIILSNGHVKGDNKPRMHVEEDRQCLNMLLEAFPGLILQESLMGQL